MTSPAETWREIDGHPGYEVSDLGRIRKLLPGGDFRIRKQNIATTYKSVSLAKRPQDRWQPTIYVHHAVAAAFLPPKQPGAVIRHLNGDRRDNRAANLAYGTPKENVADDVRLGVRAGERNGRAKLDAKLVSAVRHLVVSEGVSLSAVGRAFGISPTQAANIRDGRRWK